MREAIERAEAERDVCKAQASSSKSQVQALQAQVGSRPVTPDPFTLEFPTSVLPFGDAGGNPTVLSGLYFFSAFGLFPDAHRRAASSGASRLMCLQPNGILGREATQAERGRVKAGPDEANFVQKFGKFENKGGFFPPKSREI